MRNSTVFFLVITTLFSFSKIEAQQIVERVFIQGKVNVPPEDDAANINVVNLTSKKGTVTNEIGEFTMFVALGDEIRFSAIQYSEILVVVNENIINAKKMVISINPNINELDEVVVKDAGLTGDIAVDAGRIKTKNMFVPIDMKRDPGKTPEAFTIDNRSPITKAVVDEQFIEHGLNVANIFRAIFSRDKKEEGLPKDLDIQIRKTYDDGFFKEHLNLERDQINEFIFFVQDEKIDPELLKQENQLDFIQYLVIKSDEFKSRGK